MPSRPFSFNGLYVMRSSELSFSAKNGQIEEGTESKIPHSHPHHQLYHPYQKAQQYTSPKAHRHLHEEIPNHSSKSDAYVSVSDEHKAEAILFLVEGRPKALSQRSDPKRRIHPYKESIERGKYTEVEAKTE